MADTFDFDNLSDVAAESTIEESSEKAKKANKKSSVDEERAIEAIKSKSREILEAVQSNPELEEAFYKYSESIDLVHTLGFGDDGTFVANKKNEVDEDGNLVFDDKGKPVYKTENTTVSAIVGYEFMNNSSDTIKVATKEYYKDDAGEIQGTEIEVDWAPGTTITLANEYVLELMVRPEFSMCISCGKFIPAHRADLGGKSFSEIKKQFRFAPSQKSGVRVHDNKIKISISEEVGTNDRGKKMFKVRPEFFKTFGFLDIRKASGKTAGVKSAGTSKYNAAAIAAILRELKEQSKK